MQRNLAISYLSSGSIETHIFCRPLTELLSDDVSDHIANHWRANHATCAQLNKSKARL